MPYAAKVEHALQHWQLWADERRQALKDDPAQLERVLAGNPVSYYLPDEFEKPGFEGNRTENVFFSFAEHPPQEKDWVAIDVPEHTMLHDAACRDSFSDYTEKGRTRDEYGKKAIDPKSIRSYRWQATALPIRQFRQMTDAGLFPHWRARMNETLIRDHVPAERIIAYAKVEKELPLAHPLSDGDKRQLQDFIGRSLSFCTHFPDQADNVLMQREGDMLRIRVSVNRAKMAGREGQMKSFFDRFSSLQELQDAACKRDWADKTCLRSTRSPSR